MRKTRKAKRRPRGTLRRSRRYRRGGYVKKYSQGRNGFLFTAVTVGGKRRKSKRRSSRKKRGGTTNLRLSPHILGHNVS